MGLLMGPLSYSFRGGRHETWFDKEVARLMEEVDRDVRRVSGGSLVLKSEM